MTVTLRAVVAIAALLNLVNGHLRPVNRHLGPVWFTVVVTLVAIAALLILVAGHVRLGWAADIATHGRVPV
jgi:hypothetical protein